MRRLVLLALVTLSVFPLSAHGRWRGPRRVVIERDACRDAYRHWDDEDWDRRDRAYYRGDDRRYDCDGEDHVILRERVVLRLLPRPLPPPFQGRVEFWIR
jgi:hypothetical protein